MPTPTVFSLNLNIRLDLHNHKVYQCPALSSV
jgi:hypothetical protein